MLAEMRPIAWSLGYAASSLVFVQGYWGSVIPLVRRFGGECSVSPELAESGVNMDKW